MKFQSLVYQASYEYRPSRLDQFIVLMCSSSRFYNSSFAPNVICQRDLSRYDAPGDGLLYFLSSRSPVTCHTLQFIDRCDVFDFPPEDIPAAMDYLKGTRYFERSVKQLRLDRGANVISSLRRFQYLPNVEQLFLSLDKSHNKFRHQQQQHQQPQEENEINDDQVCCDPHREKNSFAVLTPLLSRSLTRLDISSHNRLPDDFYSVICNDILTVPETNKNDNNNNKNISTRTKIVPSRLRHLKIEVFKFATNPFFLPKPQNLVRLTRLDLLRLVLDEGSARVIGSLPSLRALRLDYCRGLDDHFMNILAEAKSVKTEDDELSGNHLHEFELVMNSRLSDGAMANFIRKTHVSTLKFEHCTCGMGEQTLESCKYVESLTYKHCDDFGANDFTVSRNMTHLKSLSFVNVNSNRYFDKDFLVALGSTETLTELRTKVTFLPFEFKCVFSRFRNLQLLSVDFSRHLADDFLTAEAGSVFANLPKLKTLEISGLRFEADFVYAILSQTASIEQLTLEMEFCEPEEFVPAAFEVIPPQLVHLDLLFALKDFTSHFTLTTFPPDFASLVQVLESLPPRLHVDVVRQDFFFHSSSEQRQEEFVSGLLELRALQRQFPNVRCSWPTVMAIPDYIWSMAVPTIDEILIWKKQQQEQELQAQQEAEEENVRTTNESNQTLPSRRARE